MVRAMAQPRLPGPQRHRAAGGGAGQVSDVFHGLRVRPNTSLNVDPPAPNSGVLDLAITMPPLRSIRSLRRTGRVVFLDVSAREAGSRIGRGAGRPLAASWGDLLARRLPFYRRAHHTVRVDGLSPGAVARQILEVL